jgi:hypothetical protein
MSAGDAFINPNKETLVRILPTYDNVVRLSTIKKIQVFLKL